MLTAQKRKFAVALMSGMSQKDAAIKAGYSEKSARSKGSQLAKDPEVIAFISRKKKEVIETDDVPTYGKKVYTPAVNSPQKKEGAGISPREERAADVRDDSVHHGEPGGVAEFYPRHDRCGEAGAVYQGKAAGGHGESEHDARDDRGVYPACGGTSRA